MRKFFFVLFISAVSPLAAQHLSHRLYLIGDAGSLSITQNGLKATLEKQHDANSKSTVLFLGDNIYPKGMPGEEAEGREKAGQILQAQLSLIEKFNSETYFIPGNHDWQRGGKAGLDFINNQRQWIDSLNNPMVHFQPTGGCPGPIEIPINNELVLVILDSQWFLHPWEKPEGEESACEAKTPEDVWIKLQDVLERNRSKRVVVAAHHPIFTYGEHGGVFTVSDHLFPLRSLHKSLYVPLPIVGSLYPLYRKVFGNIQDIAHPVNKHYRKLLASLLENSPGSIYVNGHEHALQYSVKDSVHYVTSGSGAKTTVVKQQGYSQYASARHGFATIDVYDDGTSAIRYFEVGNSAAVFEVRLPSLPVSVQENNNKLPDFTKPVFTQASLRYERGRGRMLGINYRDEWKQKIEVPVFDLGTEQGGLTILQKGGGMQTLSLRLADSLKNEYTLRSVEKYPEKAVPEILRETFAQDLVQDQISAAHPYGALVVRDMAKAANIYYTMPSVVLIPDDPRLGIYRKDFANTMALYEERPDGDASDKAHFGNSKKIVSTDKVLEKLKEDNDNKIDQEFVLRSRLFDMIIGDWDRHDDQWRWASFKEKKETTYRPIPRDRDQAFFVSDGLLAKFWSRKWALPKFEGFHDEVKWASGFMYNARYFDRSFLNGTEARQWVEQANYLKEHVTDEVIENSIKQFPEAIYKLRGEEIIRKLKSRRDKLSIYALDHYAFLAKEVDIPGSDKREWYEVNHTANGDVKVEVFKISKKGNRSEVLYDRTFHPSETKEIRLFGLGGDDVFNLQGTGSKKINVRIIGGDGKDSVSNQSDIRSVVYDIPNGVQVQNWRKLADTRSSDPTVNVYDRKSFQYPRLAPLLYGNFNFDDGLFFGGGFLLTNHGFRKQPYKSQHIFLISHSFLTEAYSFKYDGRFSQVFGKWGIAIDADAKGPNFVNNFFGWGNETIFDSEIHDNPLYDDLDRSIDYYRIRTQELMLQVKLTTMVGKNGYFHVGPLVQRVEIEEPKSSNRFLYDFAQTQPQPFFEVPKTFTGALVELGVNQVDNPRLTTRGVRAAVQSSFMRGIESYAANFTSTNGSISFYQSFRLPATLTFAVRAGGGFNTGTYDVYNAQVLDGKTELRGYRKTRFYGDSHFYNNNELRLKIASFRSYLFPASLGINGFFDIGRVWYKDETGNDSSVADGSSSYWHKGVGGGVWFTPFNISVVSAEFAHSRDGNMLYLRLGFLF